MKVISLVIALFMTPFAFAQSLPMQSLKLPKEFKASIYAEKTEGARQMCLGENNIVFVGSLEGNVYALVPNPKNNKEIQVVIIAHDLHLPTGVACHKGALYVAETSRILR